MGYFSKCCAKTNLPIVVAEKGIPRLNFVVALTPDGEVVEGSYDGYGRVNGINLVEGPRGGYRWPKVKMVLKEHYNGEKYEELPKSHDEMAQGYFMAPAFLHFCILQGPFKNRAGYVRAFKKYANW